MNQLNTNAVSGSRSKRDESVWMFGHGLVVTGISLESFRFEGEWIWECLFVVVDAMDEDADRSIGWDQVPIHHGVFSDHSFKKRNRRVHP